MTEQCSPNADVLYDNFRSDITCEVLQEFSKHNVDKSMLDRLARLIPVIYPWDDEYDSLKYNVNRRFVVFPWMIVMATESSHVVTAVEWARRYRIPIVARGGSHCFEPYSLIPGMVVDQSRRKGIKIRLGPKETSLGPKETSHGPKETSHIADVEPGCLIGPVQHELSKYSLAIASGTCPNTCVAGITLGGGIGLLTRLYGLTSDNLLGIEIVLANGEKVTANRDEYPDLFWACRGAGNTNFGIVTRFRFRVHRVEKAWIYNLKFRLDQIHSVFDRWQDWAPQTDDEMTSELDVYRDYISVTGQYIGSKGRLRELLKVWSPDKPYSIDVEEMPYIETVRHFAGKGYWSPFFKNRSGFVKRRLPSEAFDIIRDYMRRAGPDDRLECNAFGGKVSSIPSDKTAFVHRGDTLFWMHFQCHWTYQWQGRDRMRWVNGFYNKMKGYLKGAYINAADSLLEYPLREYYGDNLDRLIEIKTKYDPTNLFRYRQSIPTNRRVRWEDR